MHTDSTSGPSTDWYITGGSSGGSAAAVAAGMAFAYVCHTIMGYTSIIKSIDVNVCNIVDSVTSSVHIPNTCNIAQTVLF